MNARRPLLALLGTMSLVVLPGLMAWAPAQAAPSAHIAAVSLSASSVAVNGLALGQV